MKNGYVVGAVVVILVLGVGGFLLMSNNSAQNTQPTMQPTASTMPTTSEQPASGAATMGTIKEFTLDGSNFKFVPNEIKVKAGDTVRVTLKNVGGMHDFAIKDLNIATKITKVGEEATVEFTAPKAGTYEFICTVGNHAAQGMTGTLTVE